MRAISSLLQYTQVFFSTIEFSSVHFTGTEVNTDGNICEFSSAYVFDAEISIRARDGNSAWFSSAHVTGTEVTTEPFADKNARERHA